MALAYPSPEPRSLHRLLLAWYRKKGRHDLPWRKTREPWPVLLAELMLQRTRADLVEPIYRETLRRYPTAAALADAPEAALIELWRPLGFSHRSQRIQAAAAHCRHGVPRSIEQLLRVPGVGPYAAHATAAFAFGHRVPIVDPSVIRILARLGIAESDKSRPRADPLVWEASRGLLPRRPRDWNLALLDLGALICRPRPRCPVCPLVQVCPAGRRSSNI